MLNLSFLLPTNPLLPSLQTYSELQPHKMFFQDEDPTVFDQTGLSVDHFVNPYTATTKYNKNTQRIEVTLLSTKEHSLSWTDGVTIDLCPSVSFTLYDPDLTTRRGHYPTDQCPKEVTVSAKCTTTQVDSKTHFDRDQHIYSHFLSFKNWYGKKKPCSLDPTAMEYLAEHPVFCLIHDKTAVYGESGPEGEMTHEQLMDPKIWVTEKSQKLLKPVISTIDEFASFVLQDWMAESNVPDA